LPFPDIHTSLYWFIPIIAVLGFFNSIQFTSMNTISIADLRNFQTSSGNSLISVNQQLAIGFGIAFGLIVLKLFENTDLIQGEIHNAFRILSYCRNILSGFIFRRLHISDGKNMKSKED
jgi:hypothetical protein